MKKLYIALCMTLQCGGIVFGMNKANTIVTFKSSEQIKAILIGNHVPEWQSRRVAAAYGNTSHYKEDVNIYLRRICNNKKSKQSTAKFQRLSPLVLTKCTIN